jgi:hypothetical protein
MSPAAVVLAMIPPAFAILVERFNPISDGAIRSRVERDLQQFKRDDDAEHEALVVHSAKMVEGAVEVAGLAPTFVACLTSGFGVLSEYPNPWLIVGYILVFLALLLFLLHYLGGQTFLDMTLITKKIPLPFFGSRLPAEVISRTIYIANALLILFVLVVFLVSEHGHLFGSSNVEALPRQSSAQHQLFG